MDRYNCTRDEMIAKSWREMAEPPALKMSAYEQAMWIAASLMAWEDAHGNGYYYGSMFAEAEKIVRER